jgi:hypothetical protein
MKVEIMQFIKLKAMAEAPQKAMSIALVALFIAVIGLFVSLGGNRGH